MAPGSAREPKLEDPKKAQQAKLLSKILVELDRGGKIVDAQSLPTASRDDLTSIERQAYADFAPPPPALAHSRSSPAELGATASHRAEAAETAGSSPSCRGARSPSLRPVNCGSLHVPLEKRGFGVSVRPPIYSRQDNELGPGQYDTHQVGAYVWAREQGVSHPAQRQLSSHKSPALVSFGKPKLASSNPKAPKIGQKPGPGHYALPDLWDPNWQRYPAAGVSFVRKPAVPGESRFGGLTRDLARGSRSSMDLLSSW